MLRSSVIILLLIAGFIIPAKSQIRQNTTSNLQLGEINCFTNEIEDNKKQPDDIPFRRVVRSGARSGSWNLNDGYGTSCTHDCVVASAAPCSKYRIPVVFTISTQPGCGISTPTLSNIDAQIAITNDYMNCVGVPIEFYKSTTHPNHPTTGDFSTRYQNIGCTYTAGVLNNVPNVLNIYIFANTSYGSGANGWAILPTGSNAQNLVVMSRAAFNNFTYTNGSINCSNPALGLSIILIHEFGHILGLHHTHNELNATLECPNMSNGCVAGDYIKDTDADPGLFNACAGSGCNKSPNNCSSPCGTPYPSDINSESNIMSYNNGYDCRNTLTECQKSKLMDALLCVRGPQMCDRNVAVEFANGEADTYKEICFDGSAPTFMATSSCYNWYASLGSTSPLATGSATFTPTIGTGPGQLNNLVSGEYYWYLGDQNEINPNCRTKLTVKVGADVGTATANGSTSFISNSCTMPESTILTTTTSALPPNDIIGWWITEDLPITTTVTDDVTLISALSTATINGSISNPVNHLIQSTAGTPLKNLALPFDCGALDKEKNYFATPVLAKYAVVIPDVNLNCTTNPSLCGNASGVNFGCGYLSAGLFNTGAVSGTPTNPVNSPTFTITISNIVYPNNCTANNMLVDIRNGVNGAIIGLFLPGNVTSFTLTQNNFPGYNPANGFLVLLYDQATSSCCNGGPAVVNFSVNISISYPGLPAIAFPSISSYKSCNFGNAVPLNCSCSCLPTSAIVADQDVICPTTTVNLYSSPSGNYSYMWSNSVTDQNQQVTPLLSTSYTVTVSHNVVNCSSQATKSIYVESGNTVTNPANDGAGTLRSILSCIEEGDMIDFLTNINLTDSLEINKNINLQGDPVNSSVIEINSTSNNALIVTPNKTLSLKDIILNISGTTEPSVKIDGILNLDHSEINGTSDPIILNNGELNIIGNTISLIRKI
ncbi:MAG: hypothetical protein IPN86_08000 [Saprospiraceae bacterium]|nr:hypothetical protein [Saprospiraceae bacterium]